MGDIERVQPNHQIRPVQRDHLRVLPGKEDRRAPHQEPEDVLELHTEEAVTTDEENEVVLDLKAKEPHHIDFSA
jgi:hypothetical protein